MAHFGVDIGGTFTDSVLVVDDAVHTVKTPTTDDLVSGIAAGVDAATTRAGIDPGTIESFNHGSTVAVNTLIEGTGATTAIVTTAGFRDVFEIGEAYRDASLLYDPRGEHHPPLVRRRLRFEVPERTAADGSVVTPLDEAAVADVAQTLRDRDVGSVAVCFLHSYANPTHERRAREILRERAPEIDVSLSTDVSPEIREYTRTATTAADAYVKPSVSSYLSRLEGALEAAGVEGNVNIMKSDGGLARPSVAASRPITQVISGPVAGVKAAESVATDAAFGDVITFDMGGTSADVALVEDGQPVQESRRTVRGLEINGPFVNINTVGAGGGSIAWVDEVGALRVGPRSAGANPGPACYGRGGTEPTVTDANLVLGVLNATNFAGGEIDLDVDAARESLATIAEPLGLRVDEAAVAVREVVDSNLASAIRVVTVQEGNDPREFALMAFGGAGPAHACDVATELGIDRVVFPANSGLFSATGLLNADVSHEYVRSLVTTLEDADPDEIAAAVEDLLERARSELDAECVPPADRSFALAFDAMYEGQAHYLTVPVSATTVDDSVLAELESAFERRHEERYGFRDETNPIEVVNLRLTATGAVGLDRVDANPAEASDAADAGRGEREVRLGGDETVVTPFYEWESLGPGASLSGPAVVEARNATAWIAPSFDAAVDDAGHLVARRVER